MFNVSKKSSHFTFYFSQAIYNYISSNNSKSKLIQQFQYRFNNNTNSNKIVNIDKHFVKSLILHHFQYAMRQLLGYI